MNAIADIFSVIRIGEMQQHKALSVFPLLMSPQCDLSPCYLLLDQALASGNFKISEVSESGVVPTLRAENGLDQPVFLLDGEELVGAKQNRVLNISILVPAFSAIEIPVSCVERGRWSRRTANFRSSGRTQFAEARARKMRSVSDSLASDQGAKSDQRDVWYAIAAKAQRMKVQSETGAMSDIFERHTVDISAYTEALMPVENAVGAIFAIGERVVGVDLFDKAGTYRVTAPKIIAGYALDAEEVKVPVDVPSSAKVGQMLASLAEMTGSEYAAPGDGSTIRLSGGDLFGAALVVNQHCVHLAAFSA